MKKILFLSFFSISLCNGAIFGALRAYSLRSSLLPHFFHSTPSAYDNFWPKNIIKYDKECLVAEKARRKSNGDIECTEVTIFHSASKCNHKKADLHYDGIKFIQKSSMEGTYPICSSCQSLLKTLEDQRKQ